MKTFKELRESTMPKGDHVFKKKVDGTNVMIHKDSKGFTVYIDGEKLDTYKSEEQAKKMGIAFAQELE